MRILVKHFKELVEKDIVGITSTDARNTVRDWLIEVSQEQAGNDFEHAVWKYQSSPKLKKQEEDYNSQY